MIFSSSSIVPEQKIDSKYTCDGAATSPALSWSDEPSGTMSFAISCFDPDSPSGEFCHWLMVNIPSTVHALEEGGLPPAGAVEIVNDYGYAHYGPPCPGSGTHRYIFTVYALHTATVDGLHRDTFKTGIQPYIVDSASLMGYYART